MTQQIPLFPPADPEAWRALVLKSLKGEPFERLTPRAADGLTIQPLYAEAPRDVAILSKARRAPGADSTRPWDLRVIIDTADPAAANAHALEALEGGAASLLLALDATGASGVAVGSQDDLARVLDGVLLDLAPVALDAGFMGPEATNWLAVLAKGAPGAPLAFNMDPLSAFLVEGESAGPIAAHVNAAAQAGARHAGAYPRASLFLASGRAVHEAGGGDVQSLAVMAAAGVAYVRALIEAGLSADQAFERVVLGLATDQSYLTGLCALRAARALWARIIEASGASAIPKIEARGSRRMLSAKGAWNNLLRQTGAVFAAGAGGADVIAIDPFTHALGGSNALARRQARNLQLVLMEEAGVGRVADPGGGAYFFETLTLDLAREAWALFQQIEAEGGLGAALTSGLVQDQVEASRETLLASVRSGAYPLLGVSLFPDPDEQPPTLDDSRPPASGPALLTSQSGDDSRCRPLPPIRLSEAVEAA